MRKSLHIVLIAVISLLGANMLRAQAIPVFYMSDTTTGDCQGVLFDSNGGQNGDYANNENFTFTICPPGPVDSINLNFISFCTEVNLDLLRIFLGPDTTGPLVAGPFSGTTTTIPPITVYGCVTIHFVSDGSLVCSGWEMTWDVGQAIPTPPTMTVTPSTPTCSTSTLTATFSNNIDCDSLIGSSFNITGIIGQSVTASAIGCSNDSSNQAQLTLNPGLNASGTYIIEFHTTVFDACGLPWPVTAYDTISINDCPLYVDLQAVPDTICPGDCAQLIAVVTGGDSATYAYQWSNGLPATAGPHSVCPNTTTTYSVTVTDISAPPTIDQVTIVVSNPPNAQNDVTVCQSDPAFNLNANPNGGYWTGPGIIDSLQGTFYPDTAGQGVHTVYYVGPNGCRDDVIVTVTPIDAGPPNAACPGSAAFMVTGFSPSGGTWSGPNITSGGQFNPVAGGVFTVTYTINGCSDTKQIFVQNITVPIDTNYCSSAGRDTFNFSPPGGTWAGPGITNGALGAWNPAAANSGANVLTYTINGCNASFTASVFSINAGPNETACPKESPITLITASPAGGVWSGNGIIDTINGIFDPSLANNNWNGNLFYTVGGCTDQKWVWVRVTDLLVDTLLFCRNDTNLTLFTWQLVGRNPGGGIYSGPGLLSTTGNAQFQPSLAGIGDHTIHYAINGCSDSMTVRIPGPRQLTDTTVCEFDAPFQLNVVPMDHPAGGAWSGNGVIDDSGIFDPQAAGVGTHTIYYMAYDNCPDTSQIVVLPPPTVTLTGLQPFYCYNDVTIPLNVSPAGGSLTGTGLVGTGFNPALAGPGSHQLTYTFGQGACQRSSSISVIVGLPLKMTLSASDDTICLGEAVTLAAQGFGGMQSGYSYTWSQGLAPTFTHIVQPQQTTTYAVTVADSCSDILSDSVTIVVQQPFSISFDTTDVQCFGAMGYAVAIPSQQGNYTFDWSNNSSSDTAWAEVGQSLTVTVSDQGSGCAVSGDVSIPGYQAINASFITNPSTCARILDPSFDFLDVSNGGDMGTWFFGDGVQNSYIAGENIGHVYPGIGEYEITLAIQNVGGCVDTFKLEVCIEGVEIHIYNTFSPNGDGVNEYFEIDNVDAYPGNLLKIFNRYGNLIYEAAPYQNNWNGNSSKNGQPLPEGAYFYIFDKGDDSPKVSGDIVIMR